MTAERIHQVTSPLGNDVTFLLKSLVGDETLGQPFEYAVNLLAEKKDVQASALLGENLSISVRISETEKRYFNGIVSDFSHGGVVGGYASYAVVLRPWLWFLSRTANCRIFQNLNVPDIVEKICRDNGFTDFRWSLTSRARGSYPIRDYCVQYRESDLDFISRLLQHDGIYYFYEHKSDGKHIVVFADGYSSHKPIAKEAKIPFRPPGYAQVGLWHISAFSDQHRFKPTSYTHDHYDFTAPTKELSATSGSAPGGQGAVSSRTYEVYDYPGVYTETSVGSFYAQRRLEELKATAVQYQGLSDHPLLGTGATFRLTEFSYQSDWNAEYLLCTTQIELRSGEIEQFAAQSGNLLNATFVCIPSRTPYRSPQRTPKPRVHGPQTAIVVGKQGKEIWTDEYGRVKVQFHWDREGHSDENSSCWVRVAQVWAGANWGAIHIPRIGQEVMVEFLEGDPDQPIITGRFYNHDNMPPYTLPDKQTQSGLKTRSTEGGTTETFNELRFDDKKDLEQIHFHAERDFERIVENNDTLKVGFEKKKDGNQEISIYNNQTIKVGEGGCKDGSQTANIWKNRTVEIKTGDDTLKVTAGKREVTALKSIRLEVGASSILIEPAKITIKSPEIEIKADAILNMSSSGPMSIKTDAIMNVEAAAPMIIKGAIVKIN